MFFMLSLSFLTGHINKFKSSIVLENLRFAFEVGMSSKWIGIFETHFVFEISAKALKF